MSFLLNILIALLLFVTFVECNGNFTCHAVSSNEIHCSNKKTYTLEERDPPLSGAFWSDAAVSVALVVIAGCVSGLTMGLMSLDVTHLKVLLESGTDNERRYAKNVLPLVSRHHLLLVTLLVANASCAEA
jgi:metal transporter CNNM